MNKLLFSRQSNHQLTYKIFLRMASSSNYLISEPKYAFLKQLGLSETNDGVFNGRWFGDGTVSLELI